MIHTGLIVPICTPRASPARFRIAPPYVFDEGGGGTSLPPLPPHPGPLPRGRPLQNYVIPALPRHSGESRNPQSPFEAKGDASKRSEIAGVCGWGREAGWTQPITKVLQRSRRAGEWDSSIVGWGCELDVWFWVGGSFVLRRCASLPSRWMGRSRTAPTGRVPYISGSLYIRMGWCLFCVGCVKTASKRVDVH